MTSWWCNSLPAYFYWFALGMALAVLSVALARARAASSTRAAGDGAACHVLGGRAGHLPRARRGDDQRAPPHRPLRAEQAILQFALRGGVAFFLVLPAVFGDNAGGWPRRVSSWRLLGWLGLISYGIYLWHLETAKLLFNELHLGASSLLLATIVVATGNRRRRATTWSSGRSCGSRTRRPRRRTAPESEHRVATPV